MLLHDILYIKKDDIFLKDELKINEKTKYFHTKKYINGFRFKQHTMSESFYVETRDV